MLATGVPTVTVALRTPFDLAGYPTAATHLCAYSIVPAALDALAAALFGAATSVAGCPSRSPGSILAATAWIGPVSADVAQVPSSAPGLRTEPMGCTTRSSSSPSVVERFLRDASAEVERGVRGDPSGEPIHVVIAARGTSDHAAIYAQYVIGIRAPAPGGLATPCVLSLYGAAPRLERALVIGISQSGASPDVVGVVEAAAKQGAPTLAITNDPGIGPGRGRRATSSTWGPARSARWPRRRPTPPTLVAVAMLDGRSGATGGEPDGRPSLRSLPARGDRGRARHRGRRARVAREQEAMTDASCWAAATSTRPRASGRSSSRSWARCSPTRTRPPTSSTARSR